VVVSAGNSYPPESDEFVRGSTHGDQQFWLYAATDPETNELLHLSAAFFNNDDSDVVSGSLRGAHQPAGIEARFGVPIRLPDDN
jgi:hypothetical protein